MMDTSMETNTSSSPPSSLSQRPATATDSSDAASSSSSNGGANNNSSNLMNNSSTSSTSSSSSSCDSNGSSEQQRQKARRKNVLIAWVRLGFRSYGEFLASQPREVLVITLVVVISILSYFNSVAESKADAGFFCNLVFVGFSCLALCYLYYDYQKIKMRFGHVQRRSGSNVIAYISGAYVVLTFGLYALVVVSFGRHWTHFLYGWFLVPLLNDPQSVALVAQIAMCSSHPRRIKENMASAMYLDGPTFFLNSVNKILFFAFGLYLGQEGPFGWLQMYSLYAIMSVSVIAIVYFTFFPAALAVLLELWLMGEGPRWYDSQQILKSLTFEDGYSQTVQKVRVILFAGILFPHLLMCPIGEFTESYPWASWVIRGILSCMVGVFTLHYYFKDDLNEAEEQRKIYLEERRSIVDRNGPPSPAGMEEREEESEEGSAAATAGSGGDSVCGIIDEGIESLGAATGTNSSLPSSSRNSQWSGDDARTPVNLVERRTEEMLKISTGGATKETEKSVEVDSGAGSQIKSIIQTERSSDESDGKSSDEDDDEPRTLEECKEILRISYNGMKKLRDAEIALLLADKTVKAHELESRLVNKGDAAAQQASDYKRAVKLRRAFVESAARRRLDGLPFAGYEYEKVFGACCESVIGYVPLPVGAVGPILLDGRELRFPMATTEGCLVASVNRGCAALRQGGAGVASVVYRDGMTRSPCVRFPDVAAMNAAREWMEDADNFKELQREFNKTSRFAKLQSVKVQPCGRDLYIRFKARTGDAMGMNQLSKGTQSAVNWLEEKFPEMEVISLSGNFCTDKKPAAVNWVDGRGKSVVCEATVSADVVRRVLKTTPAKLAELNVAKNLVGSAVAGSVGGFNAQAANVVAALFIATGQDPAQVVSSSNCLTRMEVDAAGALRVTVDMPSLEVGTVGGGTILTAQATCLDLMGVKGSRAGAEAGTNANQLARVVCAAVLAGELSLMSALAEGHLVKSHLRHNRSELVMGRPKEDLSAGPGLLMSAATAPGPLRSCPLANLQQER